MLDRPDPEQPASLGRRTPTERADHDLSDMLQEMRVLQQGAQVLTAFLVILPFTEPFQEIPPADKWVFLATFLTSLASLVLLSAPAASHRLERPLKHIDRFKNFATRLILAGLVFQSLSWMLAAELVVSNVLGPAIGLAAAAATAMLIAVLWWIVPFTRRKRD
jgi:hypothetical protein